MGTKSKPGDYDCYANAAPDEPMFILLARDASAPFIVARWADCREDMIREGSKPKEDMAMVREARECAVAMLNWRIENNTKHVVEKGYLKEGYRGQPINKEDDR